MKLAVYSHDPGLDRPASSTSFPPWRSWPSSPCLYGLYVLYLGFAPSDDGHPPGQGHRVSRSSASSWSIVLIAVVSLILGAIFAVGAVAALLSGIELGRRSPRTPRRGGRLGDRPADDEIVRSLRHGQGRRHHPLLILDIRPGRPDARASRSGHLGSDLGPHDLDLLGRADDSGQARAAGPARPAAGPGRPCRASSRSFARSSFFRLVRMVTPRRMGGTVPRFSASSRAVSAARAIISGPPDVWMVIIRAP